MVAAQSVPIWTVHRAGQVCGHLLLLPAILWMARITCGVKHVATCCRVHQKQLEASRSRGNASRCCLITPIWLLFWRNIKWKMIFSHDLGIYGRKGLKNLPFQKAAPMAIKWTTLRNTTRVYFKVYSLISRAWKSSLLQSTWCSLGIKLVEWKTTLSTSF